MNAICRSCRDRLHELLDESSSGDAVLRELRAHLATCPDCQADLKILRAAQSELLALPKVVAPVELRAAVLAELRRPAAPGFWQSLLARPARLAWAGGAVATACFLLIVARAPEVGQSPMASLPKQNTTAEAVAGDSQALTGLRDDGAHDKGGDVAPKRGADLRGSEKNSLGRSPRELSAPLANTSSAKPKAERLAGNQEFRKTLPVAAARKLGGIEPEATAKAPAVAAMPTKPAEPFSFATPRHELAVKPDAVASAGGSEPATAPGAVAGFSANTPTVRSMPPAASPAAPQPATGPALAESFSADSVTSGAKAGGFGGGGLGSAQAPRGPVAMMNKNADGGAARRGVEPASVLAQGSNVAKPASDKTELRAVLTVGAACDVTLQFTPADDWNNVQLRLTLPEKVRTAEGDKFDGDPFRIVWQGAVRRGVPLIKSVKILSNINGLQTLRMTLEIPGERVVVLQSQTVEIVVVP